MFSSKKICKNCGYLGKSKSIGGSSIFTEIFVWIVCIFLSPITSGLSILFSLGYSVFRLFTRGKGHEGCPACNQIGTMIPTDVPMGKELYQRFYSSKE